MDISKQLLTCLLLLLVSTFAHGKQIDNAQKPLQRYEALHRRTFFYTGGEYVFDPKLNGSTFQNQMYVEQLTPAAGPSKPHPLVFLPGTLFTGAAWLNTPDNRTGWASYFLKRGYEVYLLDYPDMGRSSRSTEVYYAFTAELATLLTVPEKQPELYPQAKLHNQWPGAGVKGDPIFDRWFASQVPVTANATFQEIVGRKAICDLLGRIGPSFVLGATYAGSYMWSAADECPDLMKGIFGVEPSTTPFTPIRRPYGITATPVLYDPPIASPDELRPISVGEDSPGNRSCILQAEPAKRLVNISKVPVAFYTPDASVSITYNHCLASFLWQSGVDLDWILLGDRGIRGNGHESFIEKNNLQIAREVVEPFFVKHARK